MNASDRYLMLQKRISFIIEENGFQKTRSSFLLNCSWGKVFLDFQKSASSSKENVKFTINIGLLPESEILRTAFPLYGAKTSQDCLLRTRVGQILSVIKDKWYEINNDSQDEFVLGVLIADISAIRKWISRISSYSELANAISNPFVFVMPENTRLLIWLCICKLDSTESFEKALMLIRAEKPEIYKQLERVPKLVECSEENCKQ